MLIPQGPQPAPRTPFSVPPEQSAPTAAPTPPPVSSAPPAVGGATNGGYGGGGAGSSTPFYTSDPGYLAALMAQTTGDSQIQQMLNQQIAQSIIGYGDPSLAKQAGFTLGGQAAAEARQNYLAGNSTLSRLDKAHSDNIQSVVNQLAGRGLLFSGENGYQHGQADRAYGNNVYDAQHGVLNAIMGYRQTAMQQEQTLQSQLISALENAYNNYLSSGMYGSQGGGGGGGGGASSPALSSYAGDPGSIRASIAAALSGSQPPGYGGRTV